MAGIDRRKRNWGNYILGAIGLAMLGYFGTRFVIMNDNFPAIIEQLKLLPELKQDIKEFKKDTAEKDRILNQKIDRMNNEIKHLNRLHKIQYDFENEKSMLFSKP